MLKNLKGCTKSCLLETRDRQLQRQQSEIVPAKCLPPLGLKRIRGNFLYIAGPSSLRPVAWAMASHAPPPPPVAWALCISLLNLVTCTSHRISLLASILTQTGFFRLNYLELDSSQAVTPYYVIGSFIATLLNLEHCRCSSEKEHLLFNVVQEQEMREDVFLLNDLLGTEASLPDFSIFSRNILKA